jgi:hypothetical protein
MSHQTTTHLVLALRPPRQADDGSMLKRSQSPAFGFVSWTVSGSLGFDRNLLRTYVLDCDHPSTGRLTSVARGIRCGAFALVR